MKYSTSASKALEVANRTLRSAADPPDSSRSRMPGWGRSESHGSVRDRLQRVSPASPHGRGAEILGFGGG